MFIHFSIFQRALFQSRELHKYSFTWTRFSKLIFPLNFPRNKFQRTKNPFLVFRLYYKKIKTTSLQFLSKILFIVKHFIYINLFITSIDLKIDLIVFKDYLWTNKVIILTKGIEWMIGGSSSMRAVQIVNPRKKICNNTKNIFTPPDIFLSLGFSTLSNNTVP